MSSVLRHSQLPILLIDMQSIDGSWEYFSRMASSEPRIDLYSAPLMKHGYILDRIFKETRDERLLLVDSDLEICDSRIVNQMLEATVEEDVFGAGAIHGPSWLGSAHNLPKNVVLYQERMWIPITMLRVRHIKAALDEGYSFINRWVPNEVTAVPWLSKLLSMRFFVPVIKRIRAECLRGTRSTYHNERPNMVCCDTGADIFCHLKYDKGACFVDYGIDSLTTLAHHYHGVTRRRLNRRDNNATAIDDIMGEVLERLKQEYGIEFEHSSRAR